MGELITGWGSARRFAADAVEATLVALFPPSCAACDAPMASRPRYGLCETCFEVLEPNLGPRCERCDAPDAASPCAACRAEPPPFAALRAPYVYGGPVADLVVATKFRGREDLATALGRLLADDDEARELAAAANCLVPIPLGLRRRRKRGFNQSAVMARVTGRSWDLPVRYLLKRTRETLAQSDLPLADRLDNVADAFAPRGQVSGTVALVDDVVTSTETVRQASLALQKAGADRVVVLALARAPLPEISGDN